VIPDWPKRLLFSAGRRLRRAVGVVLPPVLLAGCLFGDTLPVQTAPWLGPVFQEIVAACRDRETQWMVVACLTIYLASLLAVERRLEGGRFWRRRNPQVWLGALAVLVLARYALSYDTAATSRQVPILLGGMVLGLGARVWTLWPAEVAQRSRRRRWLLACLALLLAAGAFWESSAGATFQYRGVERWRGPWGNPNLYGLLMGAGLVLTVGLVAERCRMPDAGCQTPDRGRRRRRSWLARAGWSVAVVVFGIGLLKSYSRGAWLGTALALVWLGAQGVWSRVGRLPSLQTGKLPEGPSAGVVESAGRVFVRLWRGLVQERVAVLTLAVALGVLAFWGVSHSEWRPARRVASVGNANDFSWRNRVAAWEGALAMMADRPWAGFGWNQPEPMYDQYYRPPAIAEGMAIQLNHYFVLGMSVGLPALVCLLAYVALRLGCQHGCGTTQADGGQPASVLHSPPSLPLAPCRAATVVLLVGFWFDGGLFSLPTATVFWVLLELGTSSTSVWSPQQASGWWSWRNVVFLTLLGVGALGWARARDPWVRIWFTVRPGDAAATQAVAVLSKPKQPRPAAVYLHGSGGALLTDGNDVRQMAEPGLAVVALDYCKTNDVTCERQMAALMKWLRKADWGRPGAIACVGYSLGAEKATRFVLGDGDGTFRSLVRLAGGAFPEPNIPGSAATNVWRRLPPVWLVHGEQDDVCAIALARQAVATLRSNGVPVEATFLPGLGHWFQPDRAGVYRALGEGCRTRLSPSHAAAGSPSPLEWRLAATPLWIWWLPAGAWLAGCWGWRRRSSGTGILPVRWRGPHRQDAGATAERLLRWSLRGLAAVLALVVGARLVMPWLPAGPRTVSVAERWLVLRGARSDFAWLAAQPACAGWRIRDLLAHAELAAYNRGLVNWTLDDGTHRDAVLSPVLREGAIAEPGDWRRAMWESLYPRIRKEGSLAGAAVIVQRCLRERVSVVPGGSSGTVAADWRRQVTDAEGWERLEVAALRAVGIPARLLAGRAEYWDGNAWREGSTLPLPGTPRNER
jgi:acetyl esterase/lipase